MRACFLHQLSPPDISTSRGYGYFYEEEEEEKDPENYPPYLRNNPDFEGGIHFWQLQQFIEELASLLMNIDEDLDEVEARWKDHELFWGRYLSTGAIEYARRWNATIIQFF